jgi:Holliday junction resolvase
MPQPASMFTLPPELKAKGEQAEADFRDWLNWSGVGYMYVEQSPLNVPERLRGRIKRPDYLVGIPYAGLLAFDVKAKSVYDGDFIFDLEEVEKLARFARLFNLTVYFACLDLERPDHHWWVPLADLQIRVPERRGKRRVITMPETRAYEVSMTLSFLDVVMRHGVQALADV